MEEKQSEDILSVLFPGEEVELGNGQTVTVKPLTLVDLPKVTESWTEIMRLAEKDASASAIVEVGCKALLKILPHCIDRPPEHIAATKVPDILDIVVRQNVTDASVGKWKALIQKLIKSLPADLSEKLPLGQSQTSRE